MRYSVFLRLLIVKARELTARATVIRLPLPLPIISLTYVGNSAHPKKIPLEFQNVKVREIVRVIGSHDKDLARLDGPPALAVRNRVAVAPCRGLLVQKAGASNGVASSHGLGEVLESRAAEPVELKMPLVWTFTRVA